MKIYDALSDTFREVQEKPTQAVPVAGSDEGAKIFKSNHTKFKLMIRYERKPDGTPYTVVEKQLNKNRKYINSFDYTEGKGAYQVTDHALALQKLLKKVDRDKPNIIQAMLFLNDWRNQRELLIGDFPAGDRSAGRFVEVCFTAPNEKGHKYVQCLLGEPLRVDQMRLQNFEHKPLKK